MESNKMKITEHNIETGEIMERDMTTDEIDALEKVRKEFLEAEKAKTDKKSEILERLGITADEAALLIK
jgi:hypothetical protein